MRLTRLIAIRSAVSVLPVPDIEASLAEPTRRLTDVIGIGVLTRIFRRDLIDEVVESCGKTEARARLLPARVVVYYVLALALFYGEAYEEVMRRLVGGLRGLENWSKEWKIPTSSAISQARSRLGEEPLKELFRRVATPIARPGTRGAWFHGLRVMSIDGVVIDVPDTPENANEFGRSRTAIAESAFPQLRLVGLAECGTHAIVAAAFGPRHVYDREYTVELLGTLESGMLMLADRGFYSYDLWKASEATGADLLWRIKLHIDLPVKESLPDGSYLSSVAPKSMRSDIKRGKWRRIELYEIPVRVIEYTIPNRDMTKPHEVIRLVTTLLDSTEAPAPELAALYNERWEFEIGLDEIEVHQMGRPRVLRSRSPELVRQEVWAFLLTHYAIRSFMREAADDIDEDPDRLSFIRSLRVIRRQVTDQAGFSPSDPENLDQGDN